MSNAWNNGGAGRGSNGGNRAPRPNNGGGPGRGNNGGIRPPHNGGGGAGAYPPLRTQRPAGPSGVSAVTNNMANMNVSSSRGGGGGGAGAGPQAGGNAPQASGSQASRHQNPQGQTATGANGNGVVAKRGAKRGQRFEGDLVLSRKAVCDPEKPSKRGQGGQKVNLVANFFPMTQKPNWNLYNHRVDFKNLSGAQGQGEMEEERTFVKKKIFARAVAGNNIGLHIFDGTNLYTINRLSPNPMLLTSQRNDGVPFEITITLVGQLGPTDLAYLQFFNIIMRKCLTLLKFTLIGRHYFDAAAEIYLSDIGYQLIPGFITNIRQYESQLMMCVEITHRVLRQCTCLNIIENYNYHRARVEEALIGSVIMTRYNNRTYRIDDIDWSQTPRSTFEQRGTRISLVDYYMQKYQIKITDMRQPLLVSNPRKEDLHRGDDKKILLVPELCFPTGISEDDRKNFNKMKALAEHLQQSPNKRAQTTLGFMNRLKASDDTRRELNNWGLGFDAMNLVAIEEGRVLPSETLLFKATATGQRREVKVDQSADWTKALYTGSGSSAHSAYPLLSPEWVIIIPPNVDVTDLLNLMRTNGGGMGFPISPPAEIVRLPDMRVNAYINALRDAKNSYRQLKFILTVLPHGRDSTTVYNVVKKICLTEYGILNQCFRPTHLSGNPRKLSSVVTKLVVQINAKLGGEPWGVSLNVQTATMIVGFDVYHPGKMRTKGKKSYGAIVATTNRTTSKFFSKVSPHDNMTEISTLIQNDIIDCVKAFMGGKQFPSHIILYRDGVGEGQLRYVFDTEVRQIREALAKYYLENGKPAPPKLLFIVCTKKGNARILTKVGGNYDNPLPGTIVDNTITLPERYDFFLVAQMARPGQTVSPTTFNVLHDDIKKSPAEVQQITFQQCHTYFNWSGTVAVPGVCQYAHKLAYLTGTALDVSPGAEVAPRVQPNLLPYLYYL